MMVEVISRSPRRTGVSMDFGLNNGQMFLLHIENYRSFSDGSENNLWVNDNMITLVNAATVLAVYKALIHRALYHTGIKDLQIRILGRVPMLMATLGVMAAG